MAFKLFGLEFGKEDKKAEKIESFVPHQNDDSVVIQSSAALGGAVSYSYDSGENLKSESELVTRYREISQLSEIDGPIDDIINEAIVYSDTESTVQLNLDEVQLSDAVKKKIIEEFETVLDLMQFNRRGYDLFKQWYVDGRFYYHMIVDKNNLKKGIVELRPVDPRKIRKVRTEKPKIDQSTGTTIFTKPEEFFIFSETGFANLRTGIKISKDAIAYCSSGIRDSQNLNTLSHLHKAIKPLNNLRNLEDATVVYRLTRAPERRVFYIDVGNLNTTKAEQYLRDMMNKHKSKMTYDTVTGQIQNDRSFATMTEDFWLPRREGGRGTQIETLPGLTNTGDMTESEYFQQKLYKALNLPASRLDTAAAFNLGRSSEITRDEVKFRKFVSRLQARYSMLFSAILKTQLILKRVITLDEWKMISGDIEYTFLKDNFFQELMNQEVMQQRFGTVQQADDYVGKYLSREWVFKNILQFTDEEVKEIEEQNKNDEFLKKAEAESGEF